MLMGGEERHDAEQVQSWGHPREARADNGSRACAMSGSRTVRNAGLDLKLINGYSGTNCS
uniref:Conserved domain protein n=1 Tax=Bursaphelenchus xylophilus TaxID=6326 RepID=A0A1I7SHW6_BURXY